MQREEELKTHNWEKACKGVFWRKDGLAAMEGGGQEGFGPLCYRPKAGKPSIGEHNGSSQPRV